MSQIIGVPPQADQEGELLNPETESAYGGKPLFSDNMLSEKGLQGPITGK
jgi:hypothetical protein